MRLRSSAFADGATIPRHFTCDGDDVSPPLQWDAPPEGARSFVLLCDDPDAPRGTWHHWAAYDITVKTHALPEDAGHSGNREGLKQATNDFGRSGYGGPCPPPRHGPHHYRFRLLALDVDHLAIGAKPSCVEVEQVARQHLVGEATLTGIYERH